MTQHISDQTFAYIENRLSRQDRLRVELHLRECAACRDEVETIRNTSDALSDVNRVILRIPTPNRWSTIQNRLRSNIPQPIWSRPRFSTWQLSASMMLVVVLFAASSVALNTARAATPTVPVIQTPAPSLLAENLTAAVTRSTSVHTTAQTPTLTLIPLPATSRP